MFICCKCAVNFNTLKVLIKHLKYVHFVSSSDTLQCKQNGCGQMFSSFKAFTAHIKKVHKHTQTNTPLFAENVSNLNCIENDLDILNDDTNSSVVKESPAFDLIQSVEHLKERALHFCLSMHANDNMTRNDVLEIQNQVTNLCSSMAHALLSCISYGMSSESMILKDITALLEVCRNPFEIISTEHRLFKNLRESGLYEDPHRHELGNYVTEKVLNGNPTLTGKSFSAYIMPLRFQLKTFFESPGILSSTLKNMETLLSKGSICNFISGEIYSDKIKFFGDKTVIPIFIYFDDYGINNPLGSHATSVLAGYYSFPTLPQHLQSQLKYIFNLAFMKSNDQKEVGNEVSFHHIIEELTFLETEGITLNTPEQSIRVYFLLGAVLGDNLGLNSILGFSKSFNSNSFCRVCKRTKLETKRDCEEINGTLRNKLNYNLDLEIRDSQTTGLRENCTFNRIPSFHVLDNFVFDIMHDFFEGVCHYDICNILMSLLQESVISVDTLNSRKNLFQYGETEVGYISTSTIDLNRLRSFKLKMSARETWTFIHFIPLMLGDLVPTKNEPWKLLCLLLQVIDKIMLPAYEAEDIDALATLIKEHNTLYIKLYGDLKPKHHFLVHYPTFIRKCGPPKYLWSFRFEAKHQNSKKYSSNTLSRINIPYTLSIKAGLKYAKLLIDFKQGFSAEYELQNKDLLNLLDLQSFQMDLTPSQKTQLSLASVAQSGTYRGRDYKTNFYLTSFENKRIRLYKIVYIAELNENSQLHILVNEIEIKCFDHHFQSYEVGICLNRLYLKSIEYFTSPPLHLYTSNNGKVYLRNKFL